jgi:hypothetical protein
MNTSIKLTLSIDPDVVIDAKRYASEHSHSLSQLVENYFRSLTLKKSHQHTGMTDSAAPIVAELQTLIKTDKSNVKLQPKLSTSQPAESDRQLITDYILDKYAA